MSEAAAHEALAITRLEVETSPSRMSGPPFHRPTALRIMERSLQAFFPGSGQNAVMPDGSGCDLLHLM